MIDLSKISSPEEKLLVSLCGLQFDEEQIATISGYLGKVNDWSFFTRLANEHGIIALVRYNIRECGLEMKIPVDSMTVLENGYMQSLVRNTWLTERWKEVNTILGNKGIKHILLKGMALEHTIYGARGLRQMNDNDILIKSEDAFKAWYLLQQEGFTLEPFKSPLLKKIMFEFGHHLPALYKDGYSVEIHHKLLNKEKTDNIDVNYLFDNSVEIFVGGIKAFMLRPDLHLIFLIDHFERHALSGNCQLRLYTDIILLDRKSTLTMPYSFISNPNQENNSRYHKASYKATIMKIPGKHRLRFIIGDMFPSLKWMKKRYKCSNLKAVMHYPERIGKVIRLL